MSDGTRGLSAAEHFAWSRQRALDLVDAGDETGAMASLEQDLARHPGTAGILHRALRDLWYADFMLTGPSVVRPFIETLAGPR